QMLTEAHIPIVEIWDVSKDPIDILVGFDHTQVGAAVAAFFRAKGHTRFATVSANDPRALERTEGFQDAALRGGGQIIASRVTAAPSTIMAGRSAMAEILPMVTDRTALFCSSDLLAFGALTEARLHGLRVPDQLAVCGFGNFELSGAAEPPFTTVHVEGAETGRMAANFLLRRLAGEPARDTDRVQVPFRILERGST
ncbi:MAG: substrate-binding domain-containing protein, partial [Rhodospirillales bacterium]|nr:substrate-binding domain-containing protein [Rhodospirillales bacterium]